MATGGRVGAVAGLRSENNTRKNAKMATSGRITNNVARWVLSKYANYCSTRSTWLEKAGTNMCIQISQVSEKLVAFFFFLLHTMTHNEKDKRRWKWRTWSLRQLAGISWQKWPTDGCDILQDKFIQVVDDDTLLESCSLADANFQWRVIRQKANIIFIIKNQVRIDFQFHFISFPNLLWLFWLFKIDYVVNVNYKWNKK